MGRGNHARLSYYNLLYTSSAVMITYKVIFIDANGERNTTQVESTDLKSAINEAIERLPNHARLKSVMPQNIEPFHSN